MQTPATEIDQMIVQLNEFILPSSLMESFDAYRGELSLDVESLQSTLQYDNLAFRIPWSRN
jgi:hypothetical protein